MEPKAWSSTYGEDKLATWLKDTLDLLEGLWTQTLSVVRITASRSSAQTHLEAIARVEEGVHAYCDTVSIFHHQP